MSRPLPRLDHPTAMIPDHQLTPSKATATRYHLLKELGRGGMGVVHLAVSRGPQGFSKLVVLKMMRRQLVGDFESHRMFLEEARISARLTHPNIVNVYEVIDFDETPTIVMEYLEGQPLSSIMHRPAGEKAAPRLLLLYALTKVLAGLGAAHDLRDYDGTPFNLIHRDASPHNIFVLYDGQVKVLDFGIAKAERSEVETQAGTLKGKIRYMPPEQIKHLAQDRRVDIFTIGVVLWEVLAARRFWGALTDEEVVRELSASRLPALPPEANVPAELIRISARALAPDPADRYPTAEDFRHHLEDYLATAGERVGTAQLSAFMRDSFSKERAAAKALIESEVGAAKKLDDTASEDHTRALRAVPPPPAPAPRPSKWLGFIALPAAVVVASLLLMAGIFAGGQRNMWGARRAGPAPLPGNAAGEVDLCKTGSKACGGGCVSIDNPDWGCAAVGCAGCNVANATPRCNQIGRCDIAICHPGFQDCDGDGANGCETSVRTDPDHCGDCGRKCPPLAHAQRGCGDVCTIWRCAAGFRDCDGQVGDGCEIDVLNDRRNCGHCGLACGSGQKCRRGVCE
jgi:serine/threonine protein kinase